jgi:hypothetical protein
MNSTITSIDDSQRKAARLAGVAGLSSIPFVVYANFAIHARLIVEGDASQTARNILAHETLFRTSIALDLIYSTGLLVLLAALYVVLKPVDRTLALLASVLRLIYALMWLRMTLNLFDSLRLLSGAEYLRAFQTDQLQALARVALRASFDEYYVGLLFWALAATVCSYLLFKSSYIPRALAAFGIVASGWCAACTFVFIIFPGFAKAVNLWWFDTPLTLFEIATSCWFLFKGIGPSELKGSRPAHTIPAHDR